MGCFWGCLWPCFTAGSAGSWGTSGVGRGDSSSSGLTGASSSFGMTSQVFLVGWECDIVYGKSPISPGGGGFVYIEGPRRPEIQLGF